MHDPGKGIGDLATGIALGGDCLADIGVLRAQSQMFGRVASDPTVSRLIDTLAGDCDAALDAIRRGSGARAGGGVGAPLPGRGDWADPGRHRRQRAGRPQRQAAGFADVQGHGVEIYPYLSAHHPLLAVIAALIAGVIYWKIATAVINTVTRASTTWSAGRRERDN